MKWFTLALALFLVQLQPSISVTPASAEPGGAFTVTGSGFPAGERVKVLWNGSNLGGTARVGSAGTFEYGAVVPVTAGPGRHVVEAVSVGGGAAGASTGFVVVGPAVTSTSTTSTTSTTTTSTPPTTQAIAPVATTAPATSTVAPATSTAVPATSLPATSAPTQALEPAAPLADEGDRPAGVSPEVESVSPATAPLATPEPPTQSATIGGGVLITAFLAVVGATIFFLLGGRRRSEEASKARKPSPTPATHDDEGTAELPPVEAAVALQSQEWQRRMREMEPSGDLAGMVQVGGRMFGWGRSVDVSGATVARVWTSADAVRWDGVVDLPGVAAPHAVPWRDGLLVAGQVGSETGLSTACWWSADGFTWEETGARAQEALSGVALGGATAAHGILVGWGQGPDGPGLWVSDDATSWARSGIVGTFDLVAPSHSGFVAFGREAEHRRAIVARSTDGESWTRSGEETRFLFDGASVATVTSVDGGIIAAGTDIMRGIAAVWVSDDAVTWHRVPLQETTGTSMEFLVVAADRLLAVGTDAGRRTSGRRTIVVWDSTDVVTWRRMDAAEVFRSAAIDAVALVDGTLSAVGNLFVERGGGPAHSVPVGWTWTPSEVRPESERLEVPA